MKKPSPVAAAVLDLAAVTGGLMDPPERWRHADDVDATRERSRDRVAASKEQHRVHERASDP